MLIDLTSVSNLFGVKTPRQLSKCAVDALIPRPI